MTKLNKGIYFGPVKLTYFFSLLFVKWTSCLFLAVCKVNRVFIPCYFSNDI